MSILDKKHFHDEAAAYRFLERHIWPEGRICPHCGGIENSGKLKGKKLKALEFTRLYWFAWFDYYPKTEIWTAPRIRR